MKSGKYVLHMLRKSQFNRKLHSIPKVFWNEVFQLGDAKSIDPKSTLVVLQAKMNTFME